MFKLRLPAFLVALLLAVPVAGQPPETSEEPPEIITSPTAAGTVEFPHAMHADDFGIECVECHHETNATALNIPHTEYYDELWVDCQTCHRAGAEPATPQGCSACHHSSPTTIADETLSAKVVIHRSCSNCHEGGTGLDASRSCGFCHQADADVVENAAMKPEGNQNG